MGEIRPFVRARSRAAQMTVEDHVNLWDLDKRCSSPPPNPCIELRKKLICI